MEDLTSNLCRVTDCGHPAGNPHAALCVDHYALWREMGQPLLAEYIEYASIRQQAMMESRTASGIYIVRYR